MRVGRKTALGFTLGVLVGLLLASVALDAYARGQEAACGGCEAWAGLHELLRTGILMLAWGALALAAVLALSDRGPRHSPRSPLPRVGLLHPAHQGRRR